MASIAESESPKTPLIEFPSQANPQEDVKLDRSLHKFEMFLRLFGFCQHTLWSFSLSWLAFLLVGVALPLLIITSSYYSTTDKYQIKRFELEILISESLVAAISLFCISHSLRKYGVRKFFFVDRCEGHTIQFRNEYIKKINNFFRLLAVWVLPCLLLKTAREVTRVLYVQHQDSMCQSVLVLLALLVSWTYSNIIFLSGTALFGLVCNLQVIHFENYGKLLERDLDVSAYIEEHVRLTHYVSKISHRFRIFLLLELLVVTASQFAALLQTTGNRRIINLLNTGDFAVSSIVELVGLIICLHAAAKISHRAQGLASVTSRWHALVTCSNNDAPLSAVSNSSGNLEASYPGTSFPISYSESDIESADYVPVPTNTQIASRMSHYQKRQAFVSYMQCNPGGISIYGWRVDRALISTIFFIELSLVLFVLGKTITITIK